MDLTIIILAAIVIIVIAIISIVVIQNRRKTARYIQRNREYQQRQQSAAGATALVIHSNGGMAGDHAPSARITLTLEVTPPGKKTYRATTNWQVEITALSFIREGETIPVKIDTVDPKIIYPNATWAKYLPD